MLLLVIQSFADSDSDTDTDSDTERVWRRQPIRRFGSDLQRMANRKLLIIDAAEKLNDLRVPPGNRLERLRGNRPGQYSIRINDQWRICFTWTPAGAADVEIAD
jgi:toxin HigB-1